MISLAAIVNSREPELHSVTGLVDGLNLPIQCTSEFQKCKTLHITSGLVVAVILKSWFSLPKGSYIFLS